MSVLRSSNLCMASLSRLLHRSFCTSISPTNPTNLSWNYLFFKEKKLNKLAKKFKKYSKSYEFRCKHLIYQDTVRRLASAKRFSLIEEILEEQKKYRDISKEGFAIRLIKLYGESGMFDQAHKTFDQMPELKCSRTVKSFNALLNACVDSKNFDKVEKLFRELPSELSVTPDLYSYNIMIRGFCKMGSLDSALLMLDEMEKKGLKPDLVTFNTLLNSFYDSGRLRDGEKIWKIMENSNVHPNIQSFNAKLRGLVLGGNTSEAVKLVEELRTSEVKPDTFSFNALIKGFCKDGNLEEAMRIYNDLSRRDCGNGPNRATFETLLPCLCENGDFDLALKLCNDKMSPRYIDAGLLQIVVDALVENSKDEEAKKLVELAWQNDYPRASVKMPSCKK